jgi:hypothetical protein
MTDPANLPTDDQTTLATVSQRSTAIHALIGNVRDFAAMMHKLTGVRDLPQWILSRQGNRPSLLDHRLTQSRGQSPPWPPSRENPHPLAPQGKPVGDGRMVEGLGEPARPGTSSLANAHWLTPMTPLASHPRVRSRAKAT